MPSPLRTAALTLLGLRVAYGAALIVAPERLRRRWLGPAAGAPSTQVPLRGLGAREIVVHGAAIAAALRDAPLRPFLAASVAGDLADIAATVAGRGGLPDGVRPGDARRRRRVRPAHRGPRRRRRPLSAGVPIAYDRAGAGPVLVLLHPLGADRQVWEPVMDRLAAERDVIALDLPGFGGSPSLNGGGPPTPAALAAAVAAFLATVAPGGPHHVAGNSLGGWVALELAAAGHARSVTAIAPAGLWPEPLAPKRGIARGLARAIRPALPVLVRSPAGRRLALAATVAAAERVPPAAALRLVRAYADAPGFDEVNRAMRAGRFTRLEQIRVPVTLAWPEHDRLVGRPAHLPPAVRSVELPGAGHLPMWDAPELVAEVLLQGSAPEPISGGGR